MAIGLGTLHLGIHSICHDSILCFITVSDIRYRVSVLLQKYMVTKHVVVVCCIMHRTCSSKQYSLLPKVVEES